MAKCDKNVFVISSTKSGSKPIENVLILRGSGSLGAFGCGVFKALAEMLELKMMNANVRSQIGLKKIYAHPYYHIY